MFPIQDTVQSRSIPLATWGLIVVNGVVFLQELTLPPKQLQQLITLLGLVPAQLGSDVQGWWPLLTCMFLHGGWLHFLSNMWTLYLFGDNVEDRMGPVRYLIFYLLCGVAGNLTHCVTNATSTIPTIGASAAIAGVLGAYFVLFPAARILTLVPILFVPFVVEVPAVFYIGLWFLSQLFSGTLSLIASDNYQGVAWWGHIGGFVAGVVLLSAFKKPSQRYRHYYADEYWPW
jgi:membrane associated rhomboid family serine protease